MVDSGKSKVQSPKSKVRSGGRVALVVLIAVLALVPTCRKWDNPYDPVGNRPPAVPSHPSPDTNATGRDTGIVLSWQCEDPDAGDTVWFDVFLGSDSPPPMVKQASTDTFFAPTGLGWNAKYYWRIVAWDNHDDTAFGPFWRFTTAVTNHAPRAPYEPSPDSGATGLSLNTILSWKGGDPDAGDTVTYDVYFGTNDSPPRVVQAQRDSSYTPASLHYDSTYFWRIVARDNHGAEDTSSLWQFRTVALMRITAPDTNERLKLYSTDTITWTGGPEVTHRAPDSPRLMLRKDGGRSLASGVRHGASVRLDALDSTVVYRSTDDGESWIRLGRATTPGRYVWQVPEPVTESARVRVRAYASTDTMTGTSGRFAIYDTMPPSPITVTSPTDTSVWVYGSVHDVTWTGGTDGSDSSIIYYTSNNGLQWTRQGKAAAPGVFPWTVPGPATQQAKIEVRAYNGSGVAADTSETFEVLEPPYPDSVIAVAAVGTRPTALCYDSVDNRVFVALYNDSGSVSVLDGNENRVVARIDVGSYPCALVWNPAHNKVYVANQLDASVTVINAATNSVIRTVSVGAKPYALCYNPVDNKVYVANYNDSSVSVLSGATDSVLAVVAVGKSPQAVYWNSADDQVYVANYGANSVSIIDGVTNQLTHTAQVDVGPCAITSVPAQLETYVADRVGGKVTIIDAGGQSIGYVPVGQEPWALATNPVQSRVYVANSGGNSVTVIDASNHGVIGNIGVAQQPRTLWWSWQAGKLYVACYGGNSVAIIDGASGNKLRTVTVGSKPSALGWNGRGNKAYVANYDDGTVSVLGAGAKWGR